jgi:hypothetical protein
VAKNTLVSGSLEKSLEIIVLRPPPQAVHTSVCLSPILDGIFQPNDFDSCSRWSPSAQRILGTRTSVLSNRGRCTPARRRTPGRPPSHRYRRRFLRPNQRCGLRLSPAFAAPRTYNLSPYFTLLTICCIEVPDHPDNPTADSPATSRKQDVRVPRVSGRAAAPSSPTAFLTDFSADSLTY